MASIGNTHEDVLMKIIPREEKLMNKKIWITVIAVVGIAILLNTLNKNKREPIIITSNASYPEMSLDTLINESDLIVIGVVDKVHSSRWNTLDGKLPVGLTIHTITPDKVIFTDINFKADQVLKGQGNQKAVRIRTLGGTVENDQMIVNGTASFELGNTYLLFLGLDTGATADINPGHYFVRGGLQGLYKVFNGKATNLKDEWFLEDLIAYIEQALSSETIPVAETPVLITDIPDPTETSTPTPAELSTETPLASDTPIGTP
jgi:hypothetical protein